MGSGFLGRLGGTLGESQCWNSVPKALEGCWSCRDAGEGGLAQRNLLFCATAQSHIILLTE